MTAATLLIRAQPGYRREAFEQGLKRAGYKLTTSMTPAKTGDLLVVWNRMKGAAEQACERWEAQGGLVIVCENGYLQPVDKTYYAISVGQHNGAGWFPVGNEDRFSKLGFEIKPWRTDGHEIVVRAQRGIGSRLMSSPIGWAERTAAKLRAMTKLPVRIAQHPGDKGKAEMDARNLVGASALVIWSSAMGVRALVEGVHVRYAAPHWVCAEAASPLSWSAERPVSNIDRRNALHKMSWGQWHFNEVATGEPFVRIREGRK